MSTGQIFIEPSQPFFYAGDTVTGHIYLNLYNSYKGGEIKLKIKAWESVLWIEEQRIFEGENPRHIDNSDLMSKSDVEVSQTSTDSSDFEKKPKKGYYRKRNGELYKVSHHIGGREFLKFTIPLGQQFGNNYIDAGQYKLPFSFVLNPEWPGTFSHKQKTQKGRIKYEMRAKCELDDGKDRKFKHKCELMIHERPQKIESKKKQIEAEAVSCCCLSQGKTKFTVFFEKNAYCIGETANMVCEIDNSECKAGILSVNASLLHVVKFKDNNGRSTYHKKNLISKEFGGLGAGETALGKDARQESLQIVNKLKSKKKVINPSSSGKYVESEYMIEVSCNVDATCNGCCNEIPRVSIPVQIYPEPYAVQPYNIPNQWNPQQMPMYAIPIPGVPQNPAQYQQQQQYPQQPQYQQQQQPYNQQQQQYQQQPYNQQQQQFQQPPQNYQYNPQYPQQQMQYPQQQNQQMNQPPNMGNQQYQQERKEPYYPPVDPNQINMQEQQKQDSQQDIPEEEKEKKEKKKEYKYKESKETLYQEKKEPINPEE